MPRKILNSDYYFENESYSSIGCFFHVSTLYKAPRHQLGVFKAQYFNRTWEAYQFQTSMKKCLEKVIVSSKTPGVIANELRELLKTL